MCLPMKQSSSTHSARPVSAHMAQFMRFMQINIKFDFLSSDHNNLTQWLPWRTLVFSCTLHHSSHWYPPSFTRMGFHAMAMFNGCMQALRCAACSDRSTFHGQCQCNTPMQLRHFSIVQKQHKDSSLLGHSAMSIVMSPMLQSTAVSSSLAKSSSPGYPDNESITSLWKVSNYLPTDMA